VEVLSAAAIAWQCSARYPESCQLGSASAVADSKQTLICTYLSAAAYKISLMRIVAFQSQYFR